MLRMALNQKVSRESFIEHYLNFNFEKNWIQTLLNLKDKNWEKFINKNHIEINSLIDEIKEIQLHVNFLYLNLDELWYCSTRRAICK